MIGKTIQKDSVILFYQFLEGFTVRFNEFGASLMRVIADHKWHLNKSDAELMKAATSFSGTCRWKKGLVEGDEIGDANLGDAEVRRY